MMTFPDTWEEFEKLYGFNDVEEIYTNNSRLIPSFRVKQWLDHLPFVQPRRGKWLIYVTFDDCYYAKCDQCHETQVFYYNKQLTNFCPNCGSHNGGDSDEEFAESLIGGDKGC